MKNPNGPDPFPFFFLNFGLSYWTLLQETFVIRVTKLRNSREMSSKRKQARQIVRNLRLMIQGAEERLAQYQSNSGEGLRALFSPREVVPETPIKEVVPETPEKETPASKREVKENWFPNGEATPSKSHQTITTQGAVTRSSNNLATPILNRFRLSLETSSLQFCLTDLTTTCDFSIFFSLWETFQKRVNQLNKKIENQHYGTGVPEMALERIMTYLSWSDLLQVEVVCSPWKNIVQKNEIWRSNYLLHWAQDSSEDSSATAKPWKERFRHLFENRECKISDEEICYGEPLDAMSANASNLAIAGVSHQIHIWDMKSNQISQVLKGHQEKIASLVWSQSPTILMSGSHDSTIRIWDTTTSDCRTLLGHNSPVLSLTSLHENNQLLSVDQDGFLYHWDLETGNQIHLMKNEIAMKAVVAWNNMIISGSDIGAIQKWDLRSGSCVKTIRNDEHAYPIYTLDSHNNILYSAGYEVGIVSVWSLLTDEYLKSIHSQQKSSIHTLVCHNSYLMSGSQDTTIQVLNPNTEKTVQSLVAHTHPIQCLQRDENRLVSADKSGSIHIWYPRVSDNIIYYGSKTDVYGSKRKKYFVIENQPVE